MKSIANKKFEEILQSGAFPEVNFKQEEGCKSYNLMEYSHRWARMLKLLDVELKKGGCGDGVFTTNRKNRNLEFACSIEKAVNIITPEKMRENDNERFRTWMD